jgi:hypothetical protein
MTRLTRMDQDGGIEPTSCRPMGVESTSDTGALGRHLSLGERKQLVQPGPVLSLSTQKLADPSPLRVEWRSDRKKPQIFVATPRDFVRQHHRQMTSGGYYDLFSAWRGS